MRNQVARADFPSCLAASGEFGRDAGSGCSTSSLIGLDARVQQARTRPNPTLRDRAEAVLRHQGQKLQGGAGRRLFRFPQALDARLMIPRAFRATLAWLTRYARGAFAPSGPAARLAKWHMPRLLPRAVARRTVR